MNKGTYGFGLPPNFATRVAPPKWNNFQPYTAPGTYNFTVPQNVYQVYGVAVGGGGNGSNVYTTVPASTNMVFPVVALPLFRGSRNSIYASNQFDTQVCSFGENLYYFSNLQLNFVSNFGISTSTNVGLTLSAADGMVFAKDGLMVAVPRSVADVIYYTTVGGTSGNWNASSTVFSAGVYTYAWGATNANLVLASSATNTVAYSINSAANFTTTAALPGLTGGVVQGLAYGAGVFVAVGASSSANQGIATSPTGQTWTARTSVISASTNWNCVRFLNNQFIAVAANGTINTSPDGITWTNRTSGTGQSLNDITYDSTIGLYLISGTNAASNQYLTSPDGITWTLRSLGVSLIQNVSTSLWCNSLNGCFVINTRDTQANGTPIAATSTDGINWRLAAEHLSSDTAHTYTNPVITGGKMYFANTIYVGGLYVGCNYTTPGGGGGGFASGIVDVVPGQTLTVTVGATSGSSSIGTNITATGGTSSGVAGTGVVTPTLRGVVTASGGAGGLGTLTNTTFNSTSWRAGSGGGGAAGWNGIAGGAGGSSSAATGAGGGGGILLGNGGSSTAAGAGGGGGAGFAGGSTSTVSFGGGGTNSAASALGGNGFSCSGGAPGVNGGNPTTTVSLNYVLSLLSGAFEGAGGGGGGSSTSGGNGSGIGGGGGGGAPAAAPFAGGNGAIGGGGGGASGSTTTGSGLGGGVSPFLGGGGGQGVPSNSGGTFLTGWGGSSGAGGGGGAHAVGMATPLGGATMPVAAGAAVGANVPGSKVNGAAGAGGTGYVALLWTEGY